MSPTPLSPYEEKGKELVVRPRGFTPSTQKVLLDKSTAKRSKKALVEKQPVIDVEAFWAKQQEMVERQERGIQERHKEKMAQDRELFSSLLTCLGKFLNAPAPPAP